MIFPDSGALPDRAVLGGGGALMPDLMTGAEAEIRRHGTEPTRMNAVAH